MGALLLLFIVLPATELFLLLELGRQIGVFETLTLIVLTGVVGASLARNQGLRVLTQAQRELAEGVMPAEPLTDGVMILLAAALLITPGILTDAFGFLCLVPAFRALAKRQLLRRLKLGLEEGRVQMNFRGGFRMRGGAARDPHKGGSRAQRSWRDAPPRGPIVDVTADPVDDSSPPVSPGSPKKP